MECGFYHPERGYWQAISEPCAATLAGYPEGTIEVPLKPGADHEWQDGEWVHAPPAEPTADDLRAQMPAISRRQLRLTLVRNGISLDAVQGAIDSIEDDLARTEAQIEWDDASSYERLNPTLLSVAARLGITPEQVDAMWHQALEA